MTNEKPQLHTSISPALLHLYDLSNSVVVIIDVFRATSTIASALHNGAKCIIPVDSVPKAIEIGRRLEAGHERLGLERRRGQQDRDPRRHAVTRTHSSR